MKTQTIVKRMKPPVLSPESVEAVDLEESLELDDLEESLEESEVIPSRRGWLR